MTVSLMKYFGEQDRDPANQMHNGRLFWPGTASGIPFRGAHAPTLTKEEFEHVEEHWDFKFHEFDLSKQEDVEQYQWVMDRSVNGWFVVHHKEHIKDPMSGRVRFVYMEWSQRYGQLSPTAPEGTRSRGHAVSTMPLAGDAGAGPFHRLAGLQDPSAGEVG